MRITRVRIGSFGGISDRDYRMGEGMTVLYGPNESGKTSTMEFIRRTLSPNRARSPYPKPQKSDNGTLDTDSGTLELSHRDVRGDVPDVMGSMDPTVYRSVFAMGPSDLDDESVVTGGDVRSRFLTVPGGDMVGDTMSWVDGSVKDTVGLKSNSRSELLTIEPMVARAESRVSELRGLSEGYGILDAELSAKTAQLETMRHDMVDGSERKRMVQLYDSNAGNYAKLSELRDRRASLGEFHRVGQPEIEERSRLRTLVGTSKRELELAESELSVAQERLQGFDRRKVSAVSDRIGALQDGLGAYRADKRYMDLPEERTEGSTRMERRPNRTLVMAGMALVLVGLASAVLVSWVTAPLALVGAVVALVGYNRQERVIVPGTVVPKDEGIFQRVSSYEAEVSDLCTRLGYPLGGIEDTVNGLSALSRAATDVKAKESEVLFKRNAHLTATNDYNGFLMPFSGEVGFDGSIRKTEDARSLDRDISSMVETLRSAGLDPESPICPVTWEDDGSQAAIEELNADIGRIRSDMDHILGSDEIEKAMDELSFLKATRDDILRRGAVALLSKEILTRSCSAAFDTVQPDVVRTADRYIGMMTSGTYRLEVDPMDGGLVLSSDGYRKGLDRCSSGLRAQLLLSIKLAIAREMGGGEVPMVLDDVLLPFDSDRKRGALEALAMVSDEMQVLMFTCDSETRDLAMVMEGVTVIDMK